MQTMNSIVQQELEPMYPGFVCRDLDGTHHFHVGRLPSELMFNESQFEELWNEHPDKYHEINMRGRKVKTPRWQRAYGKDYVYTGNVNKALPMLPMLEPVLDWCLATFDQRLNGILLNWYDGALGHYIGKHRDSVINMHRGAPIVTVSLGEERVFRLGCWKGSEKLDLRANDGAVFVMPFATNRAWTHEVPKDLRCQGRRIAITLRAFK